MADTEEYEFEALWDVLGIGLTIAAAVSYVLIFAGYNPVFNTFTTEVVTGHLLALGLGFVFTEGGTKKLVSHIFETIHD